MKKKYVFFLFLIIVKSFIKTAQNSVIIMADEFGLPYSTIILVKNQMTRKYENMPNDFKWRLAENPNKYIELKKKYGYYYNTYNNYNPHVIILSNFFEFSSKMYDFFHRRINMNRDEFTVYLKPKSLPLFIEHVKNLHQLINKPYCFFVILNGKTFPQACTLVSSAIKNDQKKMFDRCKVLELIKDIPLASKEHFPLDIVQIVQSYLE